MTTDSPPAHEAGFERDFLDSQQLPLAERGVSFQALFYRELQRVITQIHDMDNVEQIMLQASGDICKLINADRLTLYAVNEDRSAIVSKIKTGLNTAKDLKLPLSTQSLAGYAAINQQSLNIADVYDAQELARIDPALTFLQEVDRRTGYRTRQMLVLPILSNGQLWGVLQVINNKANTPFNGLELEGAQHICHALATAIRQRSLREIEQKRRDATIRATKYDGLVSDGVLTAEQIQQCIEQARETSRTVEHVLMEQFHIRPSQIGPSLARFFSSPYEPFRSDRTRIESIHGQLKRDYILEHGWMALEEDPSGLVIMCIDPEATRGSRVVPQVFPRFAKIAYKVTTLTEFDETLAQLYGEQGGSIDQMLADMHSPLEEDSSDESSLASEASDNELVKFVNKVIIDAHQQGASDIHIEPLPGKAKTGIRFRVDGSLFNYIEVPAHFRQAMVTRLKIMCDLDISERRKPQDGKIKFKKFGPLDIELRVATIPSAGGVEDVVMRILSSGEPIVLDQLGLTAHNKERLLTTVTKPYGLFYVCGPTGSGKTTTLHSILNHLNKPDTKIWTAEDPVEITQKGLRQVQVNKKAGIDFALIMRAFLRADPDIIMVGESRDKETVSMGVEASLTGHLVFSTLHTNSAPESIVRLLDMGMDPFNFADALLGILAQRLAKRLCKCKQAYTPDAQEIEQLLREYSIELLSTPAWQANAEAEQAQLLTNWQKLYGSGNAFTLYKAGGCPLCNQTGYKGRVGLHELLVADEGMRHLIQEKARVSELFALSVASGMRTLKMDGIEKVLMGLTDMKQVRSVCIK